MAAGEHIMGSAPEVNVAAMGGWVSCESLGIACKIGPAEGWLYRCEDAQGVKHEICILGAPVTVPGKDGGAGVELRHIEVKGLAPDLVPDPAPDPATNN